MAINIPQGVNAYTQSLNTVVPVDNTTDRNDALQTQAPGASGSSPANNPYEVNITQEARDRMEQEQAAAVEEEAQPPEPEPLQAESNLETQAPAPAAGTPQSQGNNNSPIDIVA